jgi:hypothetical protein
VDNDPGRGSESSRGWTLPRFLDRLQALHGSYSLGRYRDSIMVTVATPALRWEVEFMDDGRIEVERFVSPGDIGDSALIDALLADLNGPKSE